MHAKIGKRLSLNQWANMFLGSLLEKINPFSKQMTKEYFDEPKEIGSATAAHSDEELVLQELPALKWNCPALNQEELFLQKLQQCCVIYNFKFSEIDAYEKDVKLESLNNMLNYIVKARNILTKRVHDAILHMVSLNLFRSLSCNIFENLTREPNDPILVDEWPHLELVYNVFLSFLESDDFKTSIIEHIINQKFILKILRPFDSTDPRERGFVKWVLFHIYCKFPNLRNFIEEQISNTICEFIYISEDFNGINELLWVMSSIFEYCFTGVDERRKGYLLRVLLPLHKVASVSSLFSQLVNAIELYLMRDAGLIEPVLCAIIRFWPKTCTQKEVMFIDAIDDYLSITDATHFANIYKRIFTHMSRVIKSPHTEVADHALNLFSNKNILSLIRPHNVKIMPIVLPSLISVIKEHWSPSTLKRAHTAMEFFLVSDSSLFYVLMTKHNVQKELERKRQREREHMWRKLEEIAASNKVNKSSPCHQPHLSSAPHLCHGDGL